MLTPCSWSSAVAVAALGVVLLSVAAALPLDATSRCAPPSYRQGRHCVCPVAAPCMGTSCSRGYDADGHAVSGYDPEACVDCVCGEDTAATSAVPRAAESSENSAGVPRTQSVVSAELARSPRRPFAYLKFHKVGSTTVSVALERLAEAQRLKLCGRSTDFIPSLPCAAWTTHDTEFVLIGGGTSGIRFFVGADAALITLLRDPMERYYYDRVLAGTPDSRPLSLDELNTWLQGKGAVECDHYVRVLSRGMLELSEAKENLDAFDLVGLSERLDDFLIVLSAQLGVPPEALTYKNEKVVVGRPTVADMDVDVKARLREVTAVDRELYEYASAAFRRQKQAITDFSTRQTQFTAAQSTIDQRCTYADTNSNVLTGKDCYNL